MRILEFLNYPELLFSIDQGVNSTLEFQNAFFHSIRGSNYKDGKAMVFSDQNGNFWLWKNTRFSSLIHEIIVAFLAEELEISVPKSIVAKREQSIGLIQEWIDNTVELNNFTSCPNIRNHEDLLSLVIFLAWIGANDRHGGNYLYSDGKIYAIDFEDSFSTEVTGSELCLYFPWIKNSSKIKELTNRIRTRIDDMNLIQKLENFNEIINLKEDKRAKKALKEQLSRICYLLRHNKCNLEKIVEEYIKRSTSPTDCINLF